MSHYEGARVVDPQNVSKKNFKNSSKNGSKIDQKSMLEAIQDREPSKSVFRFFGRFDAVQIDFIKIFMDFSSKMGPEMDPKIDPKSIPKPPGLSEGPPDGPRSLWDQILDWFLTIFDFGTTLAWSSLTKLDWFLNNFHMRSESQT